jgi:hypothetical protein
MNERRLPFSDQNLPPQYQPSRTSTPTSQWSNHPPSSYYHNTTPWNASAPNTPVNPGPSFNTPGPSHFRQSPWDLQTPSPQTGNGHSFQFVQHQPPLTDATSIINNGSSAPSNQGSKRTGTSQPGTRSKRRRTATTPVEVETAPICGVGPSRLNSELPANPTATTEPPAVTVPPLQGYKSLATSRTASSNAATDVWHFMRPLDRREKPEEWPSRSADGSELMEKPLDCRPKSMFVGCKLCSK